VDPVDAELIEAYLDVDLIEVERNRAAKRANAATIAAAAAGRTPAQMARLVGKDRTTIQHRLKRARSTP